MIQQGAFAAYLCGCCLLRKKNEQREEQYQKLLKNQQVIEEQAKAFSSLSKDLSDVKQKSWETGMRNKI